MKTTQRDYLITFFFLFGITACQQQCSCDRPLRVATLNTLQIMFAPYMSQRLAALNTYFESSNYDVGCVQELWDTSSKTQFLTSISGKYPYFFYPPKRNYTCSAACSVPELDRLTLCIGSYFCLEQEGVFRVLRCISNNCRNVVDQLSQQCSSCLAFESGLSIDRRLDDCAGQEEVSDDVVSGCQWLFDAQSDSVLFSQFPFIETDYLYFNISPVVVISVAYGKISFNNRNVHLFCTHLSANLPLINNQPANEAQSRELIDFVRNKTSFSDPIILMGDFNHGPQIQSTDVTAEWPESYEIITTNGFQSTYIALQGPNAECTYCRSNPLQSPTSERGSDNWIIDHIYANAFGVNGFCPVNATRFAVDNSVSVSGEMVPISDHYGIEASFCVSPPQNASSTSRCEAKDK